MTPYYWEQDASTHEPKNVGQFGFRKNLDTQAQICFCAFASFSIGLNVLVLGITSYSMIFGQDLAYRGVQGSMSKAVDGLYVERKFAIRIFYTAVGSTICTGMALCFVAFDSLERQYKQMSIFMACGIGIVVYIRWRVRPRFKFAKEQKRRPTHLKIFQNDIDPEFLLEENIMDIAEAEELESTPLKYKAPSLFESTEK